MAKPNAEKAPATSKLVGFLTDRWFLSAIGALALALLVWFLGPLLAWLATDLARGLCIAVVFAVWLIANLMLDLRAARHNAEMIAKVAEAPADRARSAADSAASEEVGILRERLQEALAALRKSQSASNKKRRYLYELPWYVLIGPPGSGKTTALINSGLKFPLSDKFGKDPLRGVGGTRNCDWWFSEDAILLDTAGRYTTQDSNESVDQRAWRGFLGLLKQFRPRQPVNGVMIAIGLPDLLRMKEAERSSHARAIKSRLGELQREFGLRLPVYVLLTKTDMVAGFIEFFDDLDRETRGAVWGSTFALDEGANNAGSISGFDAEFDGLVERLNQRLLARVHDERDPERRSRIFSFPIQFATLKPMLLDFFGEIFTPSRFEDRPLLRGVYFTSATQEGTPIDRLLSTIAGTFGLAEQRPLAFSGTGRAYFITRLLRDVIFEEASLVGANPKVERRDRLIRAGAMAGVAALALFLIGGWTLSYFANSALIGQEESARAQYLAVAGPLVQPTVRDENVASVMPALDQIRLFPAGYDSAKTATPFIRSFGLNQGRKLESQATRAYRRALSGLLLPRLLIGVETQLKNNINNPDYVYAFLPLYLRLGGQGPLDRPLIKASLADLWGVRAYPNLQPEESRRRFESHIDALLEEPLTPIALDGALLTRARQVFANIPIPARAYGAVKNSAAARSLPEWRVVDHAGPSGNRVFVRTSSKLLSEGIPGFFTYRGFHEVLLPQTPAAVGQAAEEARWVLASEQSTVANLAAVRGLADQAVGLYATDFISAWDQLLADVTVAPFRNALEAADVIGILSSPTSPLKTFTLAVAEETTINRTAAPAGAGSGPAASAVGALNAAANQAASVAGRLAGAQGGSNELPGAAIDAHYKPLRDFVAGAPQGQSQLDEVIRRLGELSMQLSAQAANPGAPAVPQGAAAAQLQQQASRLPPPVGGLVAKAAGGTSSVATGATRQVIQDLYISTVLPLCRQALDGRYPFVNSSTIDVALGDFQQVFKPGGTLDAFFTSNLRPYVDSTSAPWRNRAVNNTNLRLSPALLALFERAQRVRDSFFPQSSPGMMVEFTLTPTQVSDGVQKVVLDVDGQVLTYESGSASPQRMQWPSPNGGGRARLVFTRMNGQTATLETNGAWALFRLFDRARIAGNLADQFSLTFAAEGLTASFQLRASSVRNPFRSRDFEQIRCPNQL